MYPRATDIHAKSLPRVLKCEGSKENIGFYTWKGELGELALCRPVSACSDPMQKGVGRGNRGICRPGHTALSTILHGTTCRKEAVLETKQSSSHRLRIPSDRDGDPDHGTIYAEPSANYISKSDHVQLALTVSCSCLLPRHCTRVDPGSEL